jgi:anti-sigma factor RsiW
MRCPVDDRILIEYLEGELEGPAAAEIGQHVASCDLCHAKLAQLKAARRAVSDRVSAFSPPDESFWKDNLEGVARATWLKGEPAGVVRRRYLRQLAPAMAVAAVLLLALIGTFRSGVFTSDPGQQVVTVATADTISTEALVDSLYMLARLAEQYQMAYRAMESIEEIGSISEGSAYDQAEMTYPVTGNVYDALLGMEDEQVEQVLYVLASN